MTAMIRISDELIKDAKMYGKAQHRSIPKQIEYWAKIGKIAMDNPEMSVEFIQGLLIGIEEAKNKKATPFSFDSLK